MCPRSQGHEQEVLRPLGRVQGTPPFVLSLDVCYCDAESLNHAAIPQSRASLDCHFWKVLCKELEDIWETVRDVCPEMHKQLEWQGQEEPWNSPKWRQQSLQSAIVANVDEAYAIAAAALPVFRKVLNEVSPRFHYTSSRPYLSAVQSKDGDLEVW